MRPATAGRIRTTYLTAYLVLGRGRGWVGQEWPGWLGQAVAGRDGDRLAAAGDAELAEEVGDVGLDGAGTEEEPLGDLRVAHPLAEQGQHFPLPPGQADRVGV